MARVKICPICGHHNPAIRMLCEECRDDLRDVSPSEVQTASRAIQPVGIGEAEVETEKVCHECGMANGAENDRCLRCDAPLRQASSLATHPVAAGLSFPWGDVSIHDRLPIGRDESFSPIAPSLASYGGVYDNVSGRHAVVHYRNGGLFIHDLGSTNGTFINDRRIAVNSSTQIFDGDRIRFAADLVATVKIVHRNE